MPLPQIFPNLTQEAKTLQQNQNTNKELHSKDLTGPEMSQTPGNISASTTPISPGEKQETPTVFQPETQNPKLETDSMEVHKHPHHVMHKKKWNEYLLEFFMLFLAVFLGFIAENIREHYSEKKHEREFALQILEGLQQDTATLSFILAVNKIEKDDYDSLLHFIPMADNEEKWTGIYRHVENIDGAPLFVSHQVSFEQVQNIGALRYFKNQNIVRDLAEYKFWIGIISYQQSMYTQFCSDKLEPFLLGHLSENKMVQRFETHLENNDKTQSLVPSFVSNPGETLLFQNLIVQGRERLLLPQGNLVAMQERAVKLIQLLEKEYRFATD